MKTEHITTKFELPNKGIYNSIQDEKLSMQEESACKILIAPEINLEKGNEFYKYLENNTSLKSVTLVCDTLISADKLTLPGVDVKIYARTIDFKKNAGIDVSGKDKGSAPEQSAGDKNVTVTVNGKERTVQRRADVEDGDKGGDLEVYCDKLTVEDKSEKYFISNGSKGQNPLSGRNGADGKPIKAVLDTPEKVTDYIHDKGIHGDDDIISESKRGAINHYIKNRKNKGWGAGDHPDYYDTLVKALSTGNVGNIKFNLKLASIRGYSNDKYEIKLEATNGKDALGDSEPSNGGDSGSIESNDDEINKYFKNIPAKGSSSKEYKGGNLGLEKIKSKLTFEDFDGTQKDTLNPGETLEVGEYLMSKNGQYKLIMQSDGNLVLYDNKDTVYWASNTNNEGYTKLLFSYGAVYFCRDDNTTSSRIGGASGDLFKLQNDRNLVLYDDNSPTWSSKTVSEIINDGYCSLSYAMDVTNKLDYTHVVDFQDIRMESISLPTNGYTFKAETGVNGKKGTVKQNALACSWLHPALMEIILNYAKDLYIGGHIDKLELLIRPYIKALNKLKLNYTYDNKSTWEKGQSLWENNQFISLLSVKSELNSMNDNLQNGLDYYGNSRSYMPSISLAVASEFYKKQITKNLPVAIISEAILDKYNTTEMKQEVLVRTINDMGTKVVQAMDVIKQENKKVLDLETQLFGSNFESAKPVTDHEVSKDKLDINNLSKAIKDDWPVARKVEFVTRVMKRRDTEIKIEIQDKKAKLALYKDALKIGAVALKVIPFGQPALGAIGGTALEATAAYLEYSNGEEVDWGKAVNFSRLGEYWTYHKAKKKMASSRELTQSHLSTGATSMANIYNKKDIYEYKDAQGNIIKKDPKKWLGDNLKELDAIQKKMDNSRKTLESNNFKDALSGAQSIYKGWGVSEKNLQKAYSALKKHDKQMEIIAEQLEKVNNEKALLARKLDKTYSKISEAQSVILNANYKLLHMSSIKNVLAESFNAVLAQMLQMEKRKAYDNLYYYHYLLVKSYESYLLSSCPVKFNTSSFIQQLDNALKSIDKAQSTTSIYDDLLKKTELIEKFYDTTIITTSDIAAAPSRSEKSTNWHVDGEIISNINESLLNSNKDSSKKGIYLNSSEIKGITSILNEQFDVRLSCVDLKKGGRLDYTLKDSEGKTYDMKQQGSQVLSDSKGDFTYEIKGRHRIYISFNEGGTVKKPNGVNIVLSPESNFSYYWQFDFNTGTLTDDVGLQLHDSNIKALITEKGNDFSLNEIIALPPLDTRFLLQYNADSVRVVKKYTTGKKEEIKVVPCLDKLTFKLKYYSEIKLMMAS